MPIWWNTYRHRSIEISKRKWQIQPLKTQVEQFPDPNEFPHDMPRNKLPPINNVVTADIDQVILVHMRKYRGILRPETAEDHMLCDGILWRIQKTYSALLFKDIQPVYSTNKSIRLVAASAQEQGYHFVLWKFTGRAES